MLLNRLQILHSKGTAGKESSRPRKRAEKFQSEQGFFRTQTAGHCPAGGRTPGNGGTHQRRPERFSKQGTKDADGAFLNPVWLKDVEGSDPKIIGKKLNEIADKTNTNGEYFTIGTLYGFMLLVKTKNTQKEGLFMRGRSTGRTFFVKTLSEAHTLSADVKRGRTSGFFDRCDMGCEGCGLVILLHAPSHAVKMFIFSDYFFLVFLKNSLYLCPEFYADKGQSETDRRDI
jgi:hypothetical protein